MKKSGSALTDPFDNLAPGVCGMFRRWRCEPDVGMVALENGSGPAPQNVQGYSK